MKKAAILTALCGIIFAGITTTCYAAPNWGRFLPRPIVMPVDSTSLSSDITVVAIDFRKYLPRPIIAPTDSTGFSSPIELAAATNTPSTSLTAPWIRIIKTRAANQNDVTIAAATNTPSTQLTAPWIRIIKTRAA